MTACPNCGAVDLEKHCPTTNTNCDMLRCRRCKSYGTTKVWASPATRNGEWVARKLDG